LIINPTSNSVIINAMLMQYEKTSSRFALMGGIMGGELVTNGRTKNTQLLMKGQLVALCPINFNENQSFESRCRAAHYCPHKVFYS